MTCYLFQMWDSVMWGPCTVLGNNHCHPAVKRFRHPKNNCYIHEAVVPNSAAPSTWQLHFHFSYFHLVIFICLLLSWKSLVCSFLSYFPLSLFIPGFFFSLNLLIMAVLKCFLLIITPGDIQRHFILTDLFLCIFHNFFVKNWTSWKIYHNSGLLFLPWRSLFLIL